MLPVYNVSLYRSEDTDPAVSPDSNQWMDGPAPYEGVIGESDNVPGRWLHQHTICDVTQEKGFSDICGHRSIPQSGLKATMSCVFFL